MHGWPALRRSGSGSAASRLPSSAISAEPVNLFGDEWDATVERPNREFNDLWVGQRLGARLLGGSVYEIAAGKTGFPYHWHHGNEELLLVLSGRPTLRAPDGERELEPGEMVLFPRGPEGAHALRNDGAEPARFIMFSTLVLPDVVSYPDSGKLGAVSPHGRGIFREQDRVDYWEGEE